MKITNARIQASTGLGTKAEVWVQINGGEEKLLLRFYDDELNFSFEEFIGLTEDEGHELFVKKDVAYLQS